MPALREGQRTSQLARRMSGSWTTKKWPWKWMVRALNHPMERALGLNRRGMSHCPVGTEARMSWGD